MFSEAVELEKRDRKREALAKCSLILTVDPEHAGASEIRARIETALNVQKAQVTEKKAKRSDELYRLGTVLYNDEKTEEAAATWKEALILDPDSTKVQIALSQAETQIRLKARQTSKTGSNERELGASQRISLKKHYLDGIQYYTEGMYREAIDEWESVLRIDPAHGDAKLNIERARKRLAFISQ
jgi:tetratricopeptide (TPR) repeat protein